MRKKHSNSKSISPKMTPAESFWEAEMGTLSHYANLMIPYRELFNEVKGKKFRLTLQRNKYPEKARPWVEVISPMLEVALLNGDIDKIQGLADVMRYVQGGSKPTSPIHAALSTIREAIHLAKISYLKDPIFNKYRMKLQALAKRLPMTVSQYRQYIAVETGKEYSTPAVRTALKQLDIPIKKDTRGVQRKEKGMVRRAA